MAVTSAEEASGRALPDSIRRLAGRERIDFVWRNVLGGLTYRIGAGTGRDRFAKWAPADAIELDLAAEADRLTWAIEWVNVPRVLETGADNDGSWLLTSPLPGRSAVDARWHDHPEPTVTAIGRGLRTLHDTLPVDRCPFRWSVEDRVAVLDRDQAAATRRSAPTTSRLVVCHGDACAPNTLLDDTGNVVGHVDFGSLGIADRWADLAVALWSIEYNWGIGWAETFLAAYGIAPDPKRISYYQQLWHAT